MDNNHNSNATQFSCVSVQVLLKCAHAADRLVVAGLGAMSNAGCPGRMGNWLQAVHWQLPTWCRLTCGSICPASWDARSAMAIIIGSCL